LAEDEHQCADVSKQALLMTGDMLTASDAADDMLSSSSSSSSSSSYRCLEANRFPVQKSITQIYTVVREKQNMLLCVVHHRDSRFLTSCFFFLSHQTCSYAATPRGWSYALIIS